MHCKITENSGIPATVIIPGNFYSVSVNQERLNSLIARHFKFFKLFVGSLHLCSEGIG